MMACLFVDLHTASGQRGGRKGMREERVTNNSGNHNNLPAELGPDFHTWTTQQEILCSDGITTTQKSEAFRWGAVQKTEGFLVVFPYSLRVKGRGCHTLLKPYETNCGLWLWAIQIKFDWLIEFHCGYDMFLLTEHPHQSQPSPAPFNIKRVWSRFLNMPTTWGHVNLTFWHPATIM